MAVFQLWILTLGLVISRISALSARASGSVSSPNQQALQSMPPFPRTWVPLASVYELDGKRPNKVEFLGQSYVCFQTNCSDSSCWTVMDDACPHRLAPLSEGRIIDANQESQEIKPKDLKNTDLSKTQRLVECSYHGWAFQGDGQCARIPQATLELQQRTIASNPKCHVQSYSTRVYRQVIFAWLWPEDCLQYTDMTNDTSHAWRQPEYMLSNLGPDTTTYTRDLPYGWDTLLENIVDPAHVPWAHHGLQGSRQDAIAINMTTPGQLTEQGLEYSYDDRTLGMRRSALAQFRAPFVISYAGVFEPKTPKATAPLFNLTVIMTPIKPGWSRIIIQGGAGSRGVRAEDNDTSAVVKPKPRASLLFKVFSLFPVWLLHQFSNRFLDSDLALLHFQEQERLVKRKADYDAYCMPAPADRCIAAMRRWILQFAHICTTASIQGLPNDQVTQPLLPASPLDRSLLFDRWSQHSDQCKHCRTAMDSIKKYRRNALVVLSAGVLMSPKYLAARLVVVACLAALSLLSTAERSINKGGFDHYKNA